MAGCRRKARADRDGVGLARSAHDRVDGFGSDRSGVGLGQRQEDRLGERRLDHRQDRRRERDHDVARAGAHRGARDQPRGPGHRARSRDHDERPALLLVAVERTRWKDRRHVIGFGQPCGGRHRVLVEPDVDDPDRPRELGARQQRGADLRGAERHRELGSDRGARDRAGGAVDPARDVDRDDREARGVQHVDRGGPRGIGRAAEARAGDRVDRGVGPLELSPHPRGFERTYEDAGLTLEPVAHLTRSPGRLVGEHRDADAGAREMPRRDEPVTAVAPLPTGDHDATAVRAAHQVQTGTCDGRAGALHQRGRGCARRLRRGVQGARLLGRQQRLHPSVTATANAIAFVFSWVTVSNTRDTPSASARPFALPARAIDGAPLGCRTTLMSCHSRPR